MTSRSDIPAKPAETHTLPRVGVASALDTASLSKATTGAELYLVSFDRQGPSVMPLTRGTTVTVGRSRDCELLIAQPSISRRHFRVHVGASPTIEDLGSENGTKVNGVSVPPRTPVPLKFGELIEAGGVFFMVQDVMPHRMFPAAERVPRAGATEAPPHGLVIADPAMERLHELVSLVASASISVLVVGETGSGKELIAAAIHQRSKRAAQPYVCLNCAALPESLLESELFGYERGAFSGATQSKRGLIEAADGGTLFLDEIAEMTPATQSKMLRVLENGEFTRLGAVKSKTVDVRFVAATHQNLPALIARGAFRRDLYFRLNGMTITVPPLRERPSEIGALAEYFLARSAKRDGAAPVALSESALARLRSHGWPGNVRELRNVIERAHTLSQGRTVTADHIVLDTHVVDDALARPAASTAPATATTTATPPPAQADTPAEERSAGRLMRMDPDTEQRLIQDALDRAGGNQGRAAELLGISRRTLVNRLTEYGFKRPRKPL
jgi:DNA-binding NtrC family response regulator